MHFRHWLLASMVAGAPAAMACGSGDDAAAGGSAGGAGAGTGGGAGLDGGAGSGGTGGASTGGSANGGSAHGGSAGVAGSGGTDPSLTDFEKSLVDLPADTWLTVQKGFADKCDNGETEWHLVMGCAGLIAAWSGGVWDPKHRQMLLWGGGHADYGGNEVYAFSTRTFEWERLTEPSPGPYNQDPLADGKPVSRHTYDGLTWMDDQGLMLARGGSRASDGAGTGLTWTFDPDSKAWVNKQPTGTDGGSYDTSLVYDVGTKTAFLKASEMFYRYDAATNSYSVAADMGYPPYWPRYSGGNPRGTIDTKRHVLWLFGGGLYMLYDIANAKFVTDDWILTGGGDFTNEDKVKGHPEQVIHTGGGDIIKAAAPGVDYDSKADQIVAWKGGAPYVLDLATKTWTIKSGQGAPPTPTGTGTYGRLRYISKYNVLILVNSPGEVFFYKNTAGGEA